MTGEVTDSVAAKLQKEVTTIVKENDIENLLVDISALKGREGMANAYLYFRSPFIDRPKVNTAVVDIPENTDFLLYFHTAASKACLPLKCFTDIDTARTWLKSK